MAMVTLVPPQRSVAVGGMKSQTSPHSTVRLVMQNKTGGVVSMILTTWVKVAALLQESVAVQTRVAEKVWPHKGLVVVLVMVNRTLVPSAMSTTAGGSKSQTAPHSTVRLVRPVIAGGV